MSDITGFEKSAAAAAVMIKNARRVLVIAHIDADGITAASIASLALDRECITHRVRFAKKLDPSELQAILAEDYELLWFVDLGSGIFSQMNAKCIVADHHRPDSLVKERHVNPHLFGIDGSAEVSGAGVAYAIAVAMNEQNRDLSVLAIVGAVGDFQESAHSKLVGYNHQIVMDACRYAGVKAEIDIRTFGKQTKPLPILFQYATDPKLIDYLADQADDREACIKFFTDLGIDIDDTVYWPQLSRQEKATIVSALVNRMLDKGRGLSHVRKLLGEVYTLPADIIGTGDDWLQKLPAEMRNSARVLFDAKEFATLLNACGRHELPEVGLAVGKGDRSEQLLRALNQQNGHRESLKCAIELVKLGKENGIKEEVGGQSLRNLRFFHGQKKIKDTILGIITGMLLNSPETQCGDKPLIAFADASDGSQMLKVSGRATKEMVDRGLDLSLAMSASAQACGGSGGGHNIAAGASVPYGREGEFLLQLDRLIGRQLSGQ
ncbi:DHHA1 domain-containing protein [Candidatus Methanomassiliicoccus intestinalis]|uniref:DHHA1 domain-containing protein n=1 Tax=Candidatus Methanomassiliicoccus intestinalis TaxID=1406512 RepID=UPI0037DC3A19